MSVETKHNEYTNNLSKWTFCRDVIDGDDAIKAKKTKYVPSLSGQSTDEYTAMLNRPVFENYTQRTLDGLSGLVFAKPPTCEVPKTLEALFKNIDSSGKTLTDVAQDVVNEVMTTDRVGIFIDIAAAEIDGMTALEVELLNLRPYMKTYATENIINWKYENINNNQVLSMVVLSEQKEVWKDEFTMQNETIYRVLSLTDGIYNVRVFEKDTKTANYIPTSTFFPKIKGKFMSVIPFVGINSTSLSLTPTKPLLYDLAKVNLTHFKTNVDYYHGMHFTALPTPYGAGINLAEDEEIKVGSTSFMMFDNPSAKLSFLEFTGDGLGTLEREKTELKDTMVVLGSNMLQGDKNTAEAENTVAMRNAGQNASLISVSDTCSRGIEKALQFMSAWMGDNSEVTYSLNTDYNLTEMDAQKILALNTVQMSGNLSKEDVFNAYKKGEIINESKTFEEHQTQLEEETPALSVPPKKQIEEE